MWATTSATSWQAHAAGMPTVAATYGYLGAQTDTVGGAPMLK
jgi:hypothetical protein